MSPRTGRLAFLGLVAGLALPDAASAAPLSPLIVFQRAAPLNQLIMGALIAAAVACVVVCAAKLAAGPARAGGSTFLSALRVGGPLAGLLGAAFAVFRLFLGASNAAAPVTLGALAPGLAESFQLVALGLAVGAIAVVANWALEARLDRAVLKA